MNLPRAHRAITLVALGSLTTVPLTWAAGDHVPSGTATPQAIRGARVDVGAARSVVLDDIPQATPAELALHPAPVRPRNGLTDEQHRARKLQAEIISRSTANGLNALAVGENFVVQVVNTAITVLDKRGNV